MLRPLDSIDECPVSLVSEDVTLSPSISTDADTFKFDVDLESLQKSSIKVDNKRYDESPDKKTRLDATIHEVERERAPVPTANDSQNLRGLVLSAVDSWFLEVFATLQAIGLIIAIFMILNAYDDEQTSTWTAPVSLSAVIAALSAISRMTLGMVLSEVISQSRWTWFTSPRPLYDMELVDQASRGIWGTLLVLPKTLKRPSLLVTLLVSLSAIAMEPFAQQAVGIVQCDYIDSNERASIPNVHTLGDLSGRLSPTAAESTTTSENDYYDPAPPFDSSAQIGIIASIMDPKNNNSAILATCPTGNCTFPQLLDEDGSRFTHRAPGVCSRCFNVSSMVSHNSTVLRQTAESTRLLETWTLPNGHFVELTTERMFSYRGNIANVSLYTNPPLFNLTSDMSLAASSETIGGFNSSIHVLLNLTFLAFDGMTPSYHDFAKDGNNTNRTMTTWSSRSSSATLCALYPCLRTYLASIDKGVLNETIVSSEPMKAYGDIKYQQANAEFVVPENSSTAADMISVRTPCIVQGKLYSAENITTAPGAVRLVRSLPNNDDSKIPWYESRGNLSGTDRQIVKITAPVGCLYVIDLLSWYNRTGFMLQRAMDGTCFARYSSSIARVPTDHCLPPGVPLSDGWRPQKKGDMLPFWLEGIARLQKRGEPQISSYMEDLSESLTRRFRMGTFDAPFRAEPGNEWRASPEVVVGKAWRTTTCFAVDWEWLVLSLSLTVLTAVMLAWTVVRGAMKGDVVYKSSILPLIYHGDRIVAVEGDHEGQKSCKGLRSMKRDAKRIKVVFRD